jgi:hypothetical protein
MDHEAMAKIWDRLAADHAQLALMLSKPTGNSSFDKHNLLFAETEKSEATRCRSFAEDFRRRAKELS